MEVPFHRPSITESDIAAVSEVLWSGWLTSGPRAGEFERRFARSVGAEHAVAVNSCTAALHLALAAHGVGPGDEVILPTMTFASTAEVAVHLGATPVLVDVLPETLNIDPAAVAGAITERTRAIMPVHYGGQAADVAAINELALDSGAVVIEDAAHAFPTRHEGQAIGGMGTTACFSFYANKTITTAEGGMVTTNDEDLAGRIRGLSLHGMSNDAWDRFRQGRPWDYTIATAGYKYNMPDLAAALGLAQMDRAHQLRDARQEIARRYNERFAAITAISPLECAAPDDSSWHLFVIRLDQTRMTIPRDEFIREMNERGVATSVHYRPLHLHPFYMNGWNFDAENFPIATGAFESILSLPIFPDMTDEEINYVADTVAAIAEEFEA